MVSDESNQLVREIKSYVIHIWIYSRAYRLPRTRKKISNGLKVCIFLAVSHLGRIIIHNRFHSKLGTISAPVRPSIYPRILPFYDTTKCQFVSVLGKIIEVRRVRVTPNPFYKDFDRRNTQIWPIIDSLR